MTQGVLIVEKQVMRVLAGWQVDSPSVGHDLATEHTGIGELMRGKGGRVCFLERQRLAVAALTLPRRLLGSWLHADSPHLGPP